MRKAHIEYRGAYDGWLVWKNEIDGEDTYHRANDEKIVDSFSTEEYGPVYFKTENGRYYRNLYEITKEEYNYERNKI